MAILKTVKALVLAAALFSHTAVAAITSGHGLLKRDGHSYIKHARGFDVAAHNSSQEVVPIGKRDANARFTNFEPGANACGGTSTASDFIVALNSEQYGNGEHCFAMITVSYGGKSTQAQIVDECPGCPNNALDLSPGLFSFLADINLGEIYGEWEYQNAAPPPSPTVPPPPPTPTPTPTPPPPPPPPTSAAQQTTSTTTSTTSTTASSSSSSSSTSATSTVTPSAPSFPPESNNVEGLNLVIIQIAGLFTAGAGVAIA